MSHTILDYLNEDCWRAVLQHVPVPDIIRTESTSHRWQEVVLTYLKGVRIGVTDEEEFLYNKSLPKCCHLKRSSQKYESFESWIGKLGSTVVAAFCHDLGDLEALRENCPNLETLFISTLDEEMAEYNLNENFHHLQNLCLFSTIFHDEISDHCVSKFVADKELTGLEFNGDKLTGECMQTINTIKLRSLTLDGCLKLQSTYVLQFIDRLSELTKLKLNSISSDISEHIYSVLDKMPNLEWLEMDIFYHLNGYADYTIDQICGLTRLKVLRIDFDLEDEDVEALTRSCKELRCLELHDCKEVTRKGLKTILRNLGSQLTELGLFQCHDLHDNNLLEIIRRCPELTSLNIGGRYLCLSRGVLPRAAAAAAARSAACAGRRLRLDLTDSNLPEDCFNYYMRKPKEVKQEIKTEYDNLTIVLDQPNVRFLGPKQPEGWKLTDLADPLERMKAVPLLKSLKDSSSSSSSS